MKNVLLRGGAMLALTLMASPLATAGEVVIGSIMPLSGPAATYGQSFTSVVPLAREALKAEGIDLKVIAEDSAADVTTSLAAYNKLVRVDKVQAIVHSVSPVVLALGPLAERDKVVLVNSMAADPAIAKLGQFTFSTIPSYAVESADAARYAYAHGARRVAGIYQDTASGKAGWDVFKPIFESLGGKIVGEEAYKAGSTEYRAQLTRADSFGPDWIYLASYAAETGRLLAQANRMGLTQKYKFIGNAAAANAETLALGGAGAENFIHASWPFDPENGTALMKKFGADYKAKNNTMPSVYSATSYDALIVLARAIDKGAKTGAEIQESLMKKLGKYEGVTGTWSFDDKGQVGLKTGFTQIKDGKRQLVTN
jgi:branched-chain amino acid transport system substrate-binding protein